MRETPPVHFASEHLSRKEANSDTSTESDSLEDNTYYQYVPDYRHGYDDARAEAAALIEKLVAAVLSLQHHLPSNADPFDTARNTATEALSLIKIWKARK